MEPGDTVTDDPVFGDTAQLEQLKAQTNPQTTLPQDLVSWCKRFTAPTTHG